MDDFEMANLLQKIMSLAQQNEKASNAALAAWRDDLERFNKLSADEDSKEQRSPAEIAQLLESNDKKLSKMELRNSQRSERNLATEKKKLKDENEKLAKKLHRMKCFRLLELKNKKKNREHCIDIQYVSPLSVLDVVKFELVTAHVTKLFKKVNFITGDGWILTEKDQLKHLVKEYMKTKEIKCKDYREGRRGDSKIIGFSIEMDEKVENFVSGLK